MTSNDEEYAEAAGGETWRQDYARSPEFHRFVVPPKHHWNKVRERTTHVGLAIQEAMSAIEKANPDTLAGIFGDAAWTNKDRLSDETLVNLLEHFLRPHALPSPTSRRPTRQRLRIPHQAVSRRQRPHRR